MTERREPDQGMDPELLVWPIIKKQKTYAWWRTWTLNSLLDVLNIFKKFVEMDDLDEKAAFDSVGVETEEKEKKELLALI